MIRTITSLLFVIQGWQRDSVFAISTDRPLSTPTSTSTFNDIAEEKESTEKIYDGQASDWARDTPSLLSDYSARPFVLEKCGDVKGLRILDLGCGEGYVSRKLISMGCGSVTGIDISPEMINNAERIEKERGIQNARYISSDVLTYLNGLDDNEEQVDLIIAVFLFNYVDAEYMAKVLSKARELLVDGGRIIFTVPHPSLPFMKKDKFPFYFDATGKGYFSGRGDQFEGEIWKLDRKAVRVRCVHKTFGDYFAAFAAAGFTRMPEVHELHVSDDHLEIDKEFFGPLEDLPLHVMFELHKA